MQTARVINTRLTHRAFVRPLPTKQSKWSKVHQPTGAQSCQEVSLAYWHMQGIGPAARLIAVGQRTPHNFQSVSKGKKMSKVLWPAQALAVMW